MRLIDDVARFGACDPEPLVAASFACPYCLHHSPVVDLTALGGQVASAGCTCESCGAHWVLSLSGDQALRLNLAPPAGVAVRPAREL